MTRLIVKLIEVPDQRFFGCPHNRVIVVLVLLPQGDKTGGESIEASNPLALSGFDEFCGRR